jgi:hypothetical protein
MSFDQLKQKNIALIGRLLARDPHQYNCDDMRPFPPGPFTEEDVADIGFALSAAGYNPVQLGFQTDHCAAMVSPGRHVFADLVMSTAATAADSVAAGLPLSADCIRVFNAHGALALATVVAIAGESSKPWMVELFALAASWTARPRPGSAAEWAKAILVETIASALTRSAVACSGAEELAEWDESTPDTRSNLVATFTAAGSKLTGDDAWLLDKLLNRLTAELALSD